VYFSALLLAETTGFRAVEVHVDRIQVALGGASWRIGQAVTVISLVDAILAKTAGFAATADDHGRAGLAFSDASPDFAHWNRIFAASIGAGSSGAATAASRASIRAAAAAASGTASLHRVLDPLNVTRHARPNGWHSWYVASAVAEGGDAGDFVFAICSSTGDRSARISHASADTAVTQAVVVLLTDTAPLTAAISVIPDLSSDGLQCLVPVFVLGLHGESPSGNVAELSFVIGSRFRQTNRTNCRIIEGNRRSHLQQSDVVVVAGSAIVERMLHDFLDGMIDFVRVFLVDVVFSNSHGEISRIRMIFDAVTSSQNPVLVQNTATASAETLGAWFLDLELDLPWPFSRSCFMTTHNATRGTTTTAFWIGKSLGEKASEKQSQPHFPFSVFVYLSVSQNILYPT